MVSLELLLQTGISGLALKLENMENFCQSQLDDVFVLFALLFCLRYYSLDWPQLAELLKLWIHRKSPVKQSELCLSKISLT